MKLARVFSLLFNVMLFISAIHIPVPVEGQGPTEAPTTALDARIDDLRNGFGLKLPAQKENLIAFLKSL